MNKNEQTKRRLRQAVDGPEIRRWYATMPTAELAQRKGLTVKQIENYVYRHNMESWARKLPSVLSAENSRAAAPLPPAAAAARKRGTKI